MVAIVARPVVIDTPIGTETGLFGDELDTAAPRTIRPTQTLLSQVPGTLKFGSQGSIIIVDPPRHPSPHPVVCNRGRSLWRSRDAIVKL